MKIERMFALMLGLLVIGTLAHAKSPTTLSQEIGETIAPVTHHYDAYGVNEPEKYILMKGVTPEGKGCLVSLGVRNNMGDKDFSINGFVQDWICNPQTKRPLDASTCDKQGNRAYIHYQDHFGRSIFSPGLPPPGSPDLYVSSSVTDDQKVSYTFSRREPPYSPDPKLITNNTVVIERANGKVVAVSSQQLNHSKTTVRCEKLVDMLVGVGVTVNPNSLDSSKNWNFSGH